MSDTERKARARDRGRLRRGWTEIEIPPAKTDAADRLYSSLLPMTPRTRSAPLIKTGLVPPDPKPRKRRKTRAEIVAEKAAEIEKENRSRANQPTFIEVYGTMNDKPVVPVLTPAQIAAAEEAELDAIKAFLDADDEPLSKASQTVEAVPVAEPEHALTAAQILGAKGGKVRSAAKTKAARENAKRPRKKKG
jgi:hypothetical protein